MFLSLICIIININPIQLCGLNFLKHFQFNTIQTYCNVKSNAVTYNYTEKRCVFIHTFFPSFFPFCITVCDSYIQLYNFICRTLLTKPHNGILFFALKKDFGYFYRGERYDKVRYREKILSKILQNLYSLCLLLF